MWSWESLFDAIALSPSDDLRWITSFEAKRLAAMWIWQLWRLGVAETYAGDGGIQTYLDPNTREELEISRNQKITTLANPM